MKWRTLGVGIFALLATVHAQAADEKRALPDYTNRGKEPNTPGQNALWVPRIILSPVYLVTEYGLRWPIGHLISAAERADLPDILYNFFFFGPDHSVGLAPVAFVDFGFRPSIGLYGFWDNAFARGNDLRFHGSTGGAGWFAGVLTDRLRFHREDSIAVTFTGIRRPDQAFFGVGPDSVQSNVSRFGESVLAAQIDADFRLWRSSRIETSIALRSWDFRDGHFDEDPGIVEQTARGVYPLPAGFAHGYTTQTNHVRAALDNRLPVPADGSGFRLEADVEQGADVRRAPGAVWLRYAGSAGIFWDVNGRNRVLSLAVTAQFADSLNHHPIPFTELVTLGGSGPMRGFYPGRLRDRSAAVLTAKYRWPIWVWLDGSLQAAVGNVFGDHLEQLQLERSRFSGAIGFESVGSRDGSFELLAGLGTETFEHGGQVTSARVLVGTNRGF